MILQYSALATEVRDGRGKVPVADYKVVKYVGEEEIGAAAGSGETTRSCYSFCMCPGGQVIHFSPILPLIIIFHVFHSNRNCMDSIYFIGRLFSLVQIQLNSASMACHFLVVHPDGQMQHLSSLFHPRISRQCNVMDLLPVLSSRYLSFLLF